MSENKPILKCNRSEFVLLRVYATMQRIEFEYTPPIPGLPYYEITCPNQRVYKEYLKVLMNTSTDDEEPLGD